MLKHDFEESIGYWICTTARQLERSFNEEVLPTGITYRQCEVLAWLALEGELSQTELAERLRIEPPTLVGILDRMEREGWITREGCPNDRRRKLIRAQPKAEPVWSQIMDCAHRVRARASRGLSEEQTRSLREMLAQVQQNLREDAAAAAQGSAGAPRSRAAAAATANRPLPAR